MKKKFVRLLASALTCAVVMTGGYLYREYTQTTEEVVSIDNIPEYSGSAYCNLEDYDTLKDVDWKEGYESYSSDSLGRCTTAKALVGVETMPTDDREDISNVEPTGWNNKRYDSDLVDGGWVYNRCHLIGYQLTGENDNEENLITGTRYLNIEGMLPFENDVAEYVKDTGNHVKYKVTPVYSGSNLVASGVIMEAESVEDNGKGIDFDVYCYNVQPGISIDYATGENSLE